MTSTVLQEYSEQPVAKVAVKQLFGGLAPLVAKDAAAQPALHVIEELLDAEHSDATWENIGRVLLVELVERGIATIGKRGMMPRRAGVTFSEVADVVRKAVASAEQTAVVEARRAATRSREAFFLWALSGVSSLPTIGLSVVGLSAVDEAQRVTTDFGTITGPAQRMRRISAVNQASSRAREAAAAVLVPALAQAATAAASAAN